VRLRPNGPYLLFMAVAAALAGGGVAPADLPGAVIAIGGGLALAVFGYPFVVSTVCRVPGAGCRVPGAAVDGDGIRFPLMGVQLAWPEVRLVKRATGLRGRRQPVLLIFPGRPAGNSEPGPAVAAPGGSRHRRSLRHADRRVRLVPRSLRR
jgi:hypothetical protein